jgi:hypothetical protein
MWTVWRRSRSRVIEISRPAASPCAQPNRLWASMSSRAPAPEVSKLSCSANNSASPSSSSVSCFYNSAMPRWKTPISNRSLLACM